MELPQEKLGFLIGDLARLMRYAFEQRMEGCSLTLAQSRALVYLSYHEGLQQVELASMLEVQPITLARLIDRLQQDGLVERRPDPLDRRAYRLYLTEAAAPQLAAITRVATAIREDALRDIDGPQGAAVLAALNKMRSNLLSTPHSSSRNKNDEPNEK